MASFRIPSAAPLSVGRRLAAPVSRGLGLVLSLAILALSTLSVSILVHASRSPTAGTVIAAALPAGVTPLHRSAAPVDRSALDNGERALMALDRRDGLVSGTLQEYRDGERQIRLWTRIYRTAAGAASAYARAAGFLRRILPDPVLHATIKAVPGLGVAATLAAYRSAFGGLHYSAGALVAEDGLVVCEGQVFPEGIRDGDPSRDARDLGALTRRCLTQHTLMADRVVSVR